MYLSQSPPLGLLLTQMPTGVGMSESESDSDSLVSISSGSSADVLRFGWDVMRIWRAGALGVLIGSKLATLQRFYRPLMSAIVAVSLS